MNLRQVKPIAPTIRKISLGIIIACIVIVIFNLGASALFNPKAIVDREIDKLARDYYETFLYDNTAGNTPSETMKKYKDPGLAEVYLRQLLLFDNGRHQDSAPAFNYKGYTCDVNKTFVRFYPDEPYNKKDYHFVVNLVCE